MPVLQNGYTPLHIAAKRDQVEIAKILLDRGAKPNAESRVKLSVMYSNVPLYISYLNCFIAPPAIPVS